jgi:hypothetical protein
VRPKPGPRPPSRCARTIDIGFPDSTSFPHLVDFETGRTTLGKGDTIVIKEVRGTHPNFQVDGIYLVRGEYVLDSAPEARLALGVTGKGTGLACTTGGGRRGTVTVKRGAGTFELAIAIAYPGHPHLRFRVGKSSAGDVYFGKDAFLKR